MPTDATDKTFEDLIISNKDSLVIVDFWADWCGPCHAIAPTLARIEEESQGDVKVIKLNVDDYPEVADAFQVRGLPTLVLFINGEPDNIITGVIPYHELKAYITNLD